MTEKHAKITAPDGFTCCPDGHTKATFPQGAMVSGRVAEWALAARAASAVFDPRSERKVEAVPETKARGRKKKADSE